jgi:hypothetical protein
MKLMISALCISIASTSYSAELVKACDVGSHPSRTVEVVRDSKIASTYVYYLRQNGKRTPIFESPDQSRGESVLVECVGRKRRALVVSGEFTANARQGFVISSIGDAGELDRMDFAEKSPPQWLFQGEHEVIVIIPTSGYGETNSAYVAYRHTAGTHAADRTEAIDRLPSRSGFEVLRLRMPAR